MISCCEVGKVVTQKDGYWLSVCSLDLATVAVYYPVIPAIPLLHACAMRFCISLTLLPSIFHPLQPLHPLVCATNSSRSLPSSWLPLTKSFALLRLFSGMAEDWPLFELLFTVDRARSLVAGITQSAVGCLRGEIDFRGERAGWMICWKSGRRSGLVARLSASLLKRTLFI
jgi:hypothetical protein